MSLFLSKLTQSNLEFLKSTNLLYNKKITHNENKQGKGNQNQDMKYSIKADL